MAEFPGGIDARLGGVDERWLPGRTFDIDAPVGAQYLDVPTPTLGGALTRNGESIEPEACYPAEFLTATMGDSWFGIIHVFPFRFDFGNILTTITDTIEIYNADRDGTNSLDAFINNAGDGISITDLPTLPFSLPPQTGLTLTLQVTTDGPPSIDGTIDFDFNLYTVPIPITGSRIVMFPFRPEAPISEELEWLTEVLAKQTGKEQRISLREYPRQFFTLDFLREEGTELSRLDFLIYDWQSRVFGLPVWHEAVLTTSPLSSGATSIPVTDTTNSDYRVGGIAIVYQDEETFDALEIASITSNSITFATPIANDYPECVEVMPIRTAWGSPQLEGSRFSVNLGRRRFRFQVDDNNVGSSFADATPYLASGTGLIDGEILLDDPNWINTGSSMNEVLEREFLDIDGLTGKRARVSPWNRGKRVHSKGFITTDRDDLWAVRRLLHFLRGSQTDFWIPSFYRDLIPNATMVIGSTAIQITNVGYSRYVRQRKNRDIVRILTVDGTTLWRRITASSELSATAEQLTLSAGWDATREPSEIARIDIISNVRVDGDRIELLHSDAGGECRISFPVREVFDE